MNERYFTLTIIHQAPYVLLGMKKRGFGQGRWNGFGGKVMPSETIQEAAKRELKEEAGIDADDLKEVGSLRFEFEGREGAMHASVFKAEDFTGDVSESEEMRPEWFHQDNIPYDLMWPDDIYWLPLFLQDKEFKGRFLFGDRDVILEKELITLNI